MYFTYGFISSYIFTLYIVKLFGIILVTLIYLYSNHVVIKWEGSEYVIICAHIFMRVVQISSSFQYLDELITSRANIDYFILSLASTFAS